MHVLQNPGTKKITDFFSFFSLPSSIIDSAKYPVLDAAYLYYYATETAFEPQAEESGALGRRLESLIKDALIIAYRAKFDVFNALTLMDNVPLMERLRVRHSLDCCCFNELSCVVRSWRRSTQLLPLQLANQPNGRDGRQRRCQARTRCWSCHDLITNWVTEPNRLAANGNTKAVYLKLITLRKDV